MKKLLFIILFLSSSFLALNAQITLYGLTSGGDCGSVFSVTPSGNLQIFVPLNDTFACGPKGSLLLASDSNFYASSTGGGFADSCVIFRCNIPHKSLHIMINLDTVWVTATPFGENDLIEAMDGNLYGMTTMGGFPANGGVLYQLKLSGQYVALHYFQGGPTDGEYPYGKLAQTDDGLLWGMTSAGGVDSDGVIFNCTTSGVFNSVYSFSSTAGTTPYGDVCLANDGNFYGLTSAGGLYDSGTLFKYTPSGTFTKLVDFKGINGATPYGSLIQASNGNLYGVTSAGGDSNAGTLFQYTLSGTLTTLVNFHDTNGAMPIGTLLQASDGFLYGMTVEGGGLNGGTIFQCSLSGAFKKIADIYTIGYLGPTFNGRLIELDHLPTGLQELINKSEEVKVYPNPNNGVFMVAIGHAELVSASQTNIEIYNTLGEKIYVAALKQVQGDNPVNINNQPNGVYLYRVISENGDLIGEGKIVIQK